MHGRHRLGLAGALALSLACAPQANVDEAGFADGRTLVQTFGLFYRAPRVDLIVVVDDSASMGPFAEPWAANLRGFADVFEDDGGVDVRVAITTTSVPSPTCGGPRALGGEPIVTSCLAHLDDFVTTDEHGELGGVVTDRQAICADACSLAEIPRVLSPGRNEHDLASLAIRPWLEPANNPHGGNLDGVSLAEALTCVGLQGYAGCEFEQPIEAAARMVEHLGDPSHPLSEFRRPDAALMILFVADEDDCSHPDASATIFDPGGDQTFWTDPDASEATSAVCIEAGLVCDDAGCRLQDHALDGSVTDDPSAAVLTPVARLEAALVAAGEFDEEEGDPYVVSLGGYRSNGELRYTTPTLGVEDDELAYVDAFGVLPGCETSQPFRAPPLRAGPGGRLAAAASEGATYSICDPDWVSVLEEVTMRGFDEMAWPSCMSFECLADLSPDEPLLEPDCVLEEVDYADTRRPLPTCERDADGWAIDPENNTWVIPEDATACWVWLTDPGGLSETPSDDMELVCSEARLPGSFSIARRPGLPPLAYDSHYELRCRPCEALG